MTLNKFIENLQKLQAEGHGDKHVLYRHGASGDCGSIGSGHVTNHTNECGPFLSDMGLGNDGDEYISVYVGN